MMVANKWGIGLCRPVERCGAWRGRDPVGNLGGELLLGRRMVGQAERVIDRDQGGERHPLHRGEMILPLKGQPIPTDDALELLMRHPRAPRATCWTPSLRKIRYAAPLLEAESCSPHFGSMSAWVRT